MTFPFSLSAVLIFSATLLQFPMRRRVRQTIAQATPKRTLDFERFLEASPGTHPSAAADFVSIFFS